MSVFPQVLKNSFSLSCWFIHRWSRVTITSSRLRRVDWLPRVGHLCHEPVHVVRRVSGRLDPAVGQGDREGAGDDTVGILGLGLLEVGLAVVVGDAVLVGVRLWRQLFLWGAVGGGASGDCQADGQEGGNTEENLEGSIKLVLDFQLPSLNLGRLLIRFGFCLV